MIIEFGRLKLTCVYSVQLVYLALVNHNDRATLGKGTIIESSMTNKQLWTSLWKLTLSQKYGFLVVGIERYFATREPTEV